MTHFSHKAVLKMKRLSRNAHKHHASVYGVTVTGSVHCAWAEGFGRKSALLSLAVLEFSCLLCRLHADHPPEVPGDTRSSVLAGLSYRILPSFFE